MRGFPSGPSDPKRITIILDYQNTHSPQKRRPYLDSLVIIDLILWVVTVTQEKGKQDMQNGFGLVKSSFFASWIFSPRFRPLHTCAPDLFFSRRSWLDLFSCTLLDVVSRSPIFFPSPLDTVKFRGIRRKEMGGGRTTIRYLKTLHAFDMSTHVCT